MFKIGDIVSRINEDEHQVLAVNQAGDMIHVECIKPDAGGCFKVGDSEWNLTRRYELVRSVSATEISVGSGLRPCRMRRQCAASQSDSDA